MERIWQEYRLHRRHEDRNTLVLHYAHLVDLHAARLSRRLPRQITLDEIRSAAFDGLMQAVENFDPRRDTRFETYCQRRICGAIMDWLRTQDTQSRTVRHFERQRDRVRETFDNEVGRPPCDTEIASRMRLPVARYGELSRLSAVGEQVSLSAMQAGGGEPGCTSARSWDVPDRRALRPDHSISRKTLTAYLTRGLSRVERLILVLYYYEGLTLAEIGAALDLSESRISQMHKDVLDRLRQRFGEELSEELAG